MLGMCMLLGMLVCNLMYACMLVCEGAGSFAGAWSSLALKHQQ